MPVSASSGAPQNSGAPDDAKNIPDGIKGWSWGAFLLDWIWAIGNSTWIGLLALIPFVSLIISFILGFKGREWAWENNRWESVAHFNRVQKLWTIWGLVFIGVKLFLVIPVIGILAAIVIPAYSDYPARAQMSEAFALAGGARYAVTEHHDNNGMFPRSNADAGLPDATNITGNYVARVNVADGAIVATLKIKGVAAGVAGQTLTLTPAVTRDGKIEWTCSSSAANKYLPARCRR
ncbi:MAG: pilin [Zoogloeaceae bacterium]|nr:pilin [Zoogloeaceae bacterium]